MAEELDAHRKRQQAAHLGLTLTGMYNVLEKLRCGESLTAKEKGIHKLVLVSVLKQLYADLDAAVFDAYGWSDLITSASPASLGAPEPSARAVPRETLSATILTRLVALNAARAAEESAGQIRWLRPEYQQKPEAGDQRPTETQTELELAARALAAGKWTAFNTCR